MTKLEELTATVRNVRHLPDRDIARAVLLALWQPNDAMNAAGGKFGAIATFQAMIDAVLDNKA